MTHGWLPVSRTRPWLAIQACRIRQAPMNALASEPSVVLLVADAIVVEHRDDLLVDAVSDLVDREAGGTDGIASEFE